MKKIDRFLIGETVRDCTDTFKGHLPPELRRPLDDLVQLHQEIHSLQNNLITDPVSLKRFDKAFSRLCEYFKSNPVLKLDDSSSLSKNQR